MLQRMLVHRFWREYARREAPPLRANDATAYAITHAIMQLRVARPGGRCYHVPTGSLAPCDCRGGTKAGHGRGAHRGRCAERKPRYRGSVIADLWRRAPP